MHHEDDMDIDGDFLSMEEESPPLQGGLTNWSWCDSQKASPITLSNGNLCASRTVHQGQNPSVMTQTPFTEEQFYFRIQVTKLGRWIGVGIADLGYVLVGSKTLGTQTNCFNASYFWQDSGIRKIQASEEYSVEVSPIKEGDKIDVMLHYKTNSVFFFNNGVLQGWVKPSKWIVAPEIIFPTVNLSLGTEVTLLNDDYPTFNIDFKPTVYHFHFSTETTKKGLSICLAENNTKAAREESPKALNPAVMCQESFNRSRDHVRFRIDKLGRWLGVGFCDDKMVVTDNKTLGSQKSCINAGYFFQNSGINRIQMPGEVALTVNPLQEGDLVDIKIDFEHNVAYFFRNLNLEGVLTSTQSLLREGKLFPCTDLSVGSEVSLVNEGNPLPDLIELIYKHNLAKDRAAMSASRQGNVHQFPTSWMWDINTVKRTAYIEISPDRLTAKRESGGSNPSVMCVQPFTRLHNYFCLKVLSQGQWIGVGLADCHFALNGSKTLGQQNAGVNCSYFFQGNHRKLQMFGETTVTDVSPIKPGDLISVFVDFDNNKIAFFNNHHFEGSMSVTKTILQEGCIFPCVNLSAHSEVTIRNVDHLPMSVKLAKEYL